ncbi:hypothetical protein QFC24_005329 [Naganishia onofrii]|uniref:Uncharacterized protein n=1 Tax=Naganishia onofrii TaxID=1851511 RepID=A0ACC2X9A0_9TREE|nr:hypothetical protein QFC24_005329 [Naganishia onofrii]
MQTESCPSSASSIKTSFSSQEVALTNDVNASHVNSVAVETPTLFGYPPPMYAHLEEQVLQPVVEFDWDHNRRSLTMTRWMNLCLCTFRRHASRIPPVDSLGAEHDAYPFRNDEAPLTDFVLSPNTFALLQGYLNSEPSAKAELMKCAEEMRQTETIDPSLLPDIASHTGDYVPDVTVIDVDAAAAIPIELSNEDINDPAVAVAAALSSDEELAVVVADSDDDDDMLEGSMVVTHIL